MAEARDQVIQRWRVAEERLYPVVMVRPDLYERYITVVRAVADELRSCETLDELVEAFGDSAEITARVVRTEIISTEGMDLGLVAGAAFSLRYREVAEEEGRRDAVRRIRQGRERDEAWATVYETDSTAALPPYRRLEMRLSDGVALHVFVEVDPDTGAPVYGVEVVQLDAHTADWVTDAPPLSERETFQDPDAWQAAIARLRASAL